MMIQFLHRLRKQQTKLFRVFFYSLFLFVRRRSKVLDSFKGIKVKMLKSSGLVIFILCSFFLSSSCAFFLLLYDVVHFFIYLNTYMVRYAKVIVSLRLH